MNLPPLFNWSRVNRLRPMKPLCFSAVKMEGYWLIPPGFRFIHVWKLFAKVVLQDVIQLRIYGKFFQRFAGKGMCCRIFVRSLTFWWLRRCPWDDVQSPIEASNSDKFSLQCEWPWVLLRLVHWRVRIHVPRLAWDAKSCLLLGSRLWWIFQVLLAGNASCASRCYFSCCRISILYGPVVGKGCCRLCVSLYKSYCDWKRAMFLVMRVWIGNESVGAKISGGSKCKCKLSKVHSIWRSLLDFIRIWVGKHSKCHAFFNFCAWKLGSCKSWNSIARKMELSNKKPGLSAIRELFVTWKLNWITRTSWLALQTQHLPLNVVKPWLTFFQAFCVAFNL